MLTLGHFRKGILYATVLSVWCALRAYFSGRAGMYLTASLYANGDGTS